MTAWPATADQIAAVREIRGLAATDTIEELDRETAIGEIKSAMLTGFDFRAFLAARTPAAPKTRRISACDECGHGRATHRRTDSSGIAGLVCDRCSRMPSSELSFA